MKSPSELNDMLREAMDIAFAVCGRHDRPVAPEVRVRNMKRLWGNCTVSRTTNAPAQIAIAKRLAEDGTTQNIMNVLLHEVLHTYPDGDGHGEAFKARAALLNARGWDIYRTNDFDEVDRPAPVYILQCKKCGQEYPYYRRSRAVQRPKRYRCGKCGGPLTALPTRPSDG